MSIAENITYLHEPTDLQCGQAVLAMITGTDVQNVCHILGNDRETKLSEMKNFLADNGISFGNIRYEAFSKDELPDYCVLSLETPRCWHWSLYVHGVFYDPEHGIMDDFPECNRKYYWKLSDKGGQ